jgi:propionyl-CoA carboxylase beta chain
MHGVIAGIIDEDSFFEVHKNYAENIIVGFCQIRRKKHWYCGKPALYLAGVLDVNSSKKAAQDLLVLRLFQHPLLVLVDVPGFLPGTDQEHGIIVHGAKLLML